MDTGVCITCNATDADLNEDDKCADCAAEDGDTDMPAPADLDE